MFFLSDVIFEFRYICKPFLIRCISIEFSIQYVFCYELWIGSLTRTSFILIFYCGFDISFSTDAKNSFIIYVYIIISFQIIVYSTVAFIRGFCMYFFNCSCNAFIFQLVCWNFSMKPFIISSSTDLS